MNLTNIIGIALLVFLVCIACYALLNIIKFLILFHGRRCKYCGHIMTFKKFHEDKKGEFYDFHCEHCGAWERLKRNELFGENKTSTIGCDD